MGKGRDKKKKKSDGIAKNKSKETNKQHKLKSNNTENEEEDIDKILMQFKEKHDETYKITSELDCEPPSRRTNGVLTTNPLNPIELILFGGECFNGKTVTMFNDFFIFNTDKKQWRKITSHNQPQPRSSHQIAITTSGLLFLFGGEFVSPNETSFFHYKGIIISIRFLDDGFEDI
jgi:N-acetylneuraminic acid mutarotase